MWSHKRKIHKGTQEVTYVMQHPWPVVTITPRKINNAIKMEEKRRGVEARGKGKQTERRKGEIKKKENTDKEHKVRMKRN